MGRKLLIAGIVVIAVGLALLAYLDAALRDSLFGAGLLGGGTVNTGGGGGISFTRSGTFATGTSGGLITFSGPGAAGATSFDAVATLIVFVATVIGLLLTIAGTFSGGAAPKQATK